jgi:DNA helicase HerA-like ATPase
MNKLIIVIGAYGSGKSEYAINLAKEYSQNHKVLLVDLDVVNPYFRSRDVREQFEQEGIDVIAPDGQYKHADLPMLSPRIMGAVQQYDKLVILDVGGDPAGCRTLARYVPNIVNRGYEMHLVVNTNRPFTSDKLEVEQMIMRLESASQLQVSELICNTNLMEHTTAAVVEEGVKICNAVAKENKLKFETYLVLDSFDEIVPDNLQGKRKKVLSYFLSNPWEMPVFRGI